MLLELRLTCGIYNSAMLLLLSSALCADTPCSALAID
jgi:hypothetical protein